MLTAWMDALKPLYETAFTFMATPVTWLEAIAFVLALTMVAFNIAVNPLGWPLAAISSLLYVGLFWSSRLYGDAALQILFATLAVWGWWQWHRGMAIEGDPALGVRRLSPRGRWRAVALFALGWPLTGLFLKHFTDTDVPWWDAFPTAASLIGQWLLGRKYIENWPTWVVVNLVSIGLYLHKLLWLTALLYGVFVILSFLGWRAWQRRLSSPVG